MTTPPTTDPPPEHPEGQDDPPDVRTAVRAVLGLLEDVVEHLERYDLDRELLLRVHAHRSALHRLRRRLDRIGP